MKSLKNLVWVIGLALLVAYSCTSEKGGEKADSENDADTIAKEIPVRIEPVRVKTIPRTLDYTANFTAFKEIYFTPAAPGRIDKINVEIGDRVEKGQILVEMDKTQLLQSEIQYRNAKLTYERLDTLRQLQSISEQQYDQAKSGYDLAKSGYEYLSENTRLESPINGLVTGKYFENGELYSGAPNTQAGKSAVLTLMQINPLKAIVSISQSHYGTVKKGFPAEITTEQVPGEVFEASVSKVYPTIDAATRTFKVEILINNPLELLRPGMYANIEIELSEEQAMVVPSLAVLKQEGTNNRYVFIHEEGIAKRLPVTIGKRFDDQIEIIGEGIEAGAELIVEGQANLLDGSPIEVIED